MQDTALLVTRDSTYAIIDGCDRCVLKWAALPLHCYCQFGGEQNGPYFSFVCLNETMGYRTITYNHRPVRPNEEHEWTLMYQATAQRVGGRVACSCTTLVSVVSVAGARNGVQTGGVC
jgi:hypothetical protein